MLTSSRRDEDIERCFAAGADSYLIKPMLWDEQVSLVAGISRYLVDGTPITAPHIASPFCVERQRQAFMRWNRARLAVIKSKTLIEQSLKRILDTSHYR
jgi:CheY-like chemotaxis protein